MAVYACFLCYWYLLADNEMMVLFELQEICAKASRHAGFVFGFLFRKVRPCIPASNRLSECCA